MVLQSEVTDDWVRISVVGILPDELCIVDTTYHARKCEQLYSTYIIFDELETLAWEFPKRHSRQFLRTLSNLIVGLRERLVEQVRNHAALDFDCVHLLIDLQDWVFLFQGVL